MQCMRFTYSNLCVVSYGLNIGAMEKILFNMMTLTYDMNCETIKNNLGNHMTIQFYFIVITYMTMVNEKKIMQLLDHDLQFLHV